MTEPSKEAVEELGLRLYQAGEGTMVQMADAKWALKCALKIEHRRWEQQIRERMLAEDGPVFLTLREAIAEELEGGGFHDEECDPLYADHGACDWLGREVEKKVRSALDSIFGGAEPVRGTNEEN